MQESDLIFIGPSEEGMRIDKLLAERFPEYSRTYFQNLIEQGCVLMNGERVLKRVLPEEGDEIEICFQAIPGPSVAPEPIPLEILYEDEHLLAINKPAGMVIHPAPGHWSGTFVNALLAHCGGKAPGDDPLRPGIVHRLDKDTTGILVAAKTLAAHQKLIEMFSERRMEKLYLAVCCGRPTVTNIRAPIGRHPLHRKEMAVLSDGREAVTDIQLAAFNDQFSLLLVRPATGRTHQIRVHLKHIGCPVLGDALYGNERLNRLSELGRHLLHAYRLTFEHPITGDLLKLSAPIPEDLKSWMRRLCGPSLCAAVISY
jgi:23S rRNA pseudouridine1911/1915/1917 synthase